MQIWALADNLVVSPKGEVTPLGDLTWVGVGKVMQAGGATHVCVLGDSTAPGGGGCLMPQGLMTIKAYMRQAARLG